LTEIFRFTSAIGLLSGHVKQVIRAQWKDKIMIREAAATK
jgi:hypothetical protein